MMRATEGERRRVSLRGRDRGVSAVVSIALMLAIVLVGATSVALLGVELLAEGQDDVEQSVSETTLLQLRDDATDVTRDSAARTTELPAHGPDLQVDSTAGRINVSVINSSGGVESVLVDESLGAARYEHDDAVIAYQGTGVWKRSESGTTMVAPPQAEFRAGSLLLPVQTIDGADAIAGTARISSASTATLAPADASLDDDDRLRITVRSEYYDAWGAYWERETPAVVEYDHDARSVTATFVSTGGAPPVDASAVGTSPEAEMRVTGHGSFPTFTDSYDSRDGPYAAGSGAGGTIQSAGDVSLGGGAEVDGDVRAGKTIELSGNAAVDGDAYWSDDFEVDGAATYGDDHRIDGVDRRSNVTAQVEFVVDRLAEENDNGRTEAIADNSLTQTGETPVLPAGQYYLDELSLSSDRLVLDATDGPIRLAVEDFVSLNDNATVAVRGSHPIRLYVRSDEETSRGNNVEVRRGSTIDVPGDRASQFRLYGVETTEISIRGSGSDRSNVVGVLYAPSDDVDAAATIRHAAVYGSVVSGAVHLETGGHVAYDEALRASRPLTSAGDPWVEHVHVVRTDVRLEGK